MSFHTWKLYNLLCLSCSDCLVKIYLKFELHTMTDGCIKTNEGKSYRESL